MGLARAEIDQAASKVRTNRKSAAAPHRIDRWIELEFMIPSEFMLIPTSVKQPSYQVVICHLSSNSLASLACFDLKTPGGEMNDSILRQNLIELLRGGHAHVTLEQALYGLAPALRNVRPANSPHSVWENLEHMRLAQEDILRYTLDSSWISPPFPEGYWPKETDELTEEAWAASVTAFFADLEEVIKLVEDENLDLTAEIPHGEAHTYLREVLLVADHNAYHLGQIVQIRKALGAWRE
jgi:hypothetical protein